MRRFSNRPFIQQPPFPCNEPPLFVIPRATEGSAVRHSCARTLPAHNLHHITKYSWKRQPPLCFSAFPGEVRGTADPSVPLGMTKRGGSLQGKGGCWMKGQLLN
jgi:hypothetical protein